MTCVDSGVLLWGADQCLQPVQRCREPMVPSGMCQSDDRRGLPAGENGHRL